MLRGPTRALQDSPGRMIDSAQATPLDHPLALRSGIRFGEFAFAPGLRRLERGGALVELSSRATDILAVLTERPGEVISKEELLARVWPNSVVVEAALRVHMAALRRALGDGEDGERFITTVQGRGYCFVGALAPSADETGSPAWSLPARPTKVVGRDALVRDLIRQLEHRRFVTVVGPGGIGKTTVALLAAHDWIATHDAAAVFLDLGDLDPDSPEGVAEALCAKLGLARRDDNPAERAISYLRTNAALIVLDTCEGLIEAAAQLAEAMVAAAPDVRVLATSREALRAEGEFVNRIDALETPAAGPGLTAQEALTYPAVQLFVQRVSANDLGFELSDRNAAVVGDICRELDGVALAIELAAGRVEAFGVQQVADQLAGEVALAWPGRRTAAPRQQTLRATLNWSHEHLGPAERLVFRRLAVFVGAFPLEAGVAIGADAAELAPAEVADALSSLAAKSLLSTVIDGHARFRMLDTTRAYALERLADSGDEQATRRRHAQHYLARLTAARAEPDRPTAVAEQTANVRAALGWAFGANGEPALGVRLTGAAADFWVRQGLWAECRRWMPVAQARLDSHQDALDLRTRIILATASMLSDGRRHDLEAAYANAREQGRQDETLSGLIALWADLHRRGRYAAAERLIGEADFLDAPDAGPAQRLTAAWLRGVNDHRLGRHGQACERLTWLLGEYTQGAGHEFLRLAGYDLEVAAWTMLGLSECLRGNLDKGFAANERATAKARALSSPISLKAVLRWRALTTYFVEEGSSELDDLTREILSFDAIGDVDGPDGVALAFRGLWLARGGDCAQGVQLVTRGLNARIGNDYRAIQSLVRAEMARQLLLHDAGAQIDAFAGPLEDNGGEEQGWATPEVLRIRGEIAERRGDLALAEARYREAMALAERQDALTWGLRAAISQAELWRGQGRREAAAALLAPILERFRSTADWPLVGRASACLEACRTAKRSSRLATG